MSDHTKITPFGRDRLAFFSDAVFAIAITLLVLELRFPEGHSIAAGLAEMAPHLVGFAVSFGVIGIYWLAHHALIDRVETIDRRALALNLLLLFAIAFLPFSTGLMSGHAQDPDAVRFYAWSVIAIAAAQTLLTAHLMRDPFVRPDARNDRRRLIVRSIAPIIVFLFGLILAGWSTGWAMVSWALTLPVVRIVDASLGRQKADP